MYARKLSVKGNCCMRRDPRAYLWEMQVAADLVVKFLGATTLESYLGNELMRSAVERQMQNLGESLAQLAKADAALAARIPDYTKIIAFRNVLVHGYTTLNHERVWETVRDDLPVVRAAAEALLAELGPPSTPP